MSILETFKIYPLHAASRPEELHADPLVGWQARLSSPARWPMDEIRAGPTVYSDASRSASYSGGGWCSSWGPSARRGNNKRGVDAQGEGRAARVAVRWGPGSGATGGRAAVKAATRRPVARPRRDRARRRATAAAALARAGRPARLSAVRAAGIPATPTRRTGFRSDVHAGAGRVEVGCSPPNITFLTECNIFRCREHSGDHNALSYGMPSIGYLIWARVLTPPDRLYGDIIGSGGR